MKGVIWSLKTIRLAFKITHCCKGDDESLWEREKFDTTPPKNLLIMVAKICLGDYVGDIYHHAKFYPNRFRVSFLRMCDFAPLTRKGVYDPWEVITFPLRDPSG